jgi:hypothetical protein
VDWPTILWVLLGGVALLTAGFFARRMKLLGAFLIVVGIFGTGGWFIYRDVAGENDALAIGRVGGSETTTCSIDGSAPVPLSSIRLGSVDQADLTIVQCVDRAAASPGDELRAWVTIANTGGETLKHLQIVVETGDGLVYQTGSSVIERASGRTALDDGWRDRGLVETELPPGKSIGLGYVLVVEDVPGGSVLGSAVTVRTIEFPEPERARVAVLVDSQVGAPGTAPATAAPGDATATAEPIDVLPSGTPVASPP